MIDYTIQPTKNGKFIVRNPMGNECAKLDSEEQAITWIAEKNNRELADERERKSYADEQEKFNDAVPSLNALQLRWQRWRSWFYDELVHEDRRLGREQMALDHIPDGSTGEFGTTGSPTYAKHERQFTENMEAAASARSLYEKAVRLDGLIKTARREKNEDELNRLLVDEAEPIIAEMDGYFLSVARPEEYKKPNKPGTKPDTSIHLGAERKAWLQSQGGVQATIKKLIDEAMMG